MPRRSKVPLLSTRLLFAVCICVLSACANHRPKEQSVEMGSVLQERTPKTRVMYVSETKVVAPAIVSTLQDLGYQVEYSSSDLQLITGHKKSEQVTVTFGQIDKDFFQVRANFSSIDSDVGQEQLRYQSFFNMLSKSIFLRSNGVL